MTDNPATLIQSVRELAQEMDDVITAHLREFGEYGHGGTTVPYIVNFQLNRRTLGEEPKMLREIADTLQRVLDEAESER